MLKLISKSMAFTAGLVILASSVAVATSSPASAANTTCVDGSKRANLSVTWDSNNSISFKTKDNKQLCNDVTLFFSSYTMPDSYDGKGFTNNPTATPQHIFDSTSFTLKKGSNGARTLKVNLPEVCKNRQVDLYYGPEIKIVTPAGHGAQYITGKIFTKTATNCTPDEPPREEPPVPQPEAQTPPTPEPEVSLPQTPKAIPSTGPSIISPALITAGASAIGYAVALALKKRR